MKKIIVTTEFRDRDNFAVVYRRGETYQFDDERAESIIARGLGREEEKKAPVKARKNDK